MGYFFDKLATSKDGADTYMETIALIIFTLFVMRWPPAGKWHLLTDDIEYYTEYYIGNGAKGKKYANNQMTYKNPANTAVEEEMVNLGLATNPVRSSPRTTASRSKSRSSKRSTSLASSKGKKKR